MPRPKPVAFSDFMRDVEGGRIEKVTITGQEISGIFKADKETFHTYAPAQYEGLANKLDAQGILITAKEPTQSPWAQLLYSWAPILLVDWLLDLLHAPDAERRQQGALVRQKQGEALVELAEESDVQGRRGCRRSEGRAPGNHRVPQGTAEVPEARRPHSEGRAADGPSGNG